MQISTVLPTSSELPKPGTRAASSRLKNRTIEIFSNKITPTAMPRLMWRTVRGQFNLIHPEPRYHLPHENHVEYQKGIAEDAMGQRYTSGSGLHRCGRFRAKGSNVDFAAPQAGQAQSGGSEFHATPASSSS